MEVRRGFRGAVDPQAEEEGEEEEGGLKASSLVPATR